MEKNGWYTITFSFSFSSALLLLLIRCSFCVFGFDLILPILLHILNKYNSRLPLCVWLCSIYILCTFAHFFYFCRTLSSAIRRTLCPDDVPPSMSPRVFIYYLLSTKFFKTENLFIYFEMVWFHLYFSLVFFFSSPSPFRTFCSFNQLLEQQRFGIRDADQRDFFRTYHFGPMVEKQM